MPFIVTWKQKKQKSSDKTGRGFFISFSFTLCLSSAAPPHGSLKILGLAQMGENNRGMNHGIETFRRSITCGNFESHDFHDWAGKSKTTSGEWNSHPDIFESQKSTNPTKPPQKSECLVWNVNYKCTNLKYLCGFFFFVFLKWHLSVWHAVCLKCGL